MYFLLQFCKYTVCPVSSETLQIPSNSSTHPSVRSITGLKDLIFHIAFDRHSALRSAQYQAAAATDAARMAAEGATVPDSEIWGEDVAPDETLDPEAVVIDEGGILTEAKGPAKTKRITQKIDKMELRKIMQEQLDKLPITPAKVHCVAGTLRSKVQFVRIALVVVGGMGLADSSVHLA